MSEAQKQGASPVPEPKLQTIVQPSKRRWNKKTITIVLVMIVLCSALGAMGYFYLDVKTKYNNLQLEHTKLHSDFNQLNTNYNQLNNRYNSLNTQYSTLHARYESLSTDYSTLDTQYQSLSANYDALSTAFSKPLSYELIPSVNELKQWLASDRTDAIGYSSPSFICGDFSVMLSQHAKLKNWDTGIVRVHGYTESYQSYGHLFNAIITSDGLVYIEPQNDHVWWYGNHQSIYEYTWFEIDNEWIYVEDYSEVVWYD